MDYKSNLEKIQKQMEELTKSNSINISSDLITTEQEDTSDLLNEIGLEIQRQGGI